MASPWCCAPSWCWPDPASSRWPGSAPKPDPLQPFAAAIGRLHSGGEDASVCVDLLPGERLPRGSAAAAAATGGPSHPRRAPRLGGAPERRSSAAARGPIHRNRSSAAGRCRRWTRSCASPASCSRRRSSCAARRRRRGRAEAAMSGLLAAFRPLAERNYLRASGLPIPGLTFLGSDLPLRRGRFDRRFATGLFRPAKKTILTARELAGFLKPPTVHCGERDVLRSGALLSPPPDLPAFEKGRADLIPLGRVEHESRASESSASRPPTPSSPTSPAARATARPRRRSPSSPTSSGRGHGGLFLDPHGDALERIEPYLAEVGRRAGGADRPRPWQFAGRSAGLEPLRVGRRRRGERGPGRGDRRRLRLGAGVGRALDARDQPHHPGRGGAGVDRRGMLDAELAPTIFQIPTLLSDAEWRGAALPFLPRADQRFWTDRFPLLASEAITPVTNMVDRLRRAPSIRALLGQSQSTYRVREAMDKGKIVLACPGTGRHPRPADRQPAALRPAARRARPGRARARAAQALLGLPRRGAEL